MSRPEQASIIVPPPHTSVNFNVEIPKTLDVMSPAQIKEAATNGVFEDLFAVGDLTSPIPFQGTCAGSNVDTSLHFLLVDMNHNPNVEGEGHPMFLFNEAFCDSTYGNIIPADGHGLCMNRKGQIGDVIDNSLDVNAKAHGPTKGGWQSCYMRNTVLPELFQCLPVGWQSIIVTSTIYTDNVGNNSGNASGNVTATQDQLYLLSEKEVTGEIAYGNTGEALYQTQVRCFLNGGNCMYAYKNDDSTVFANWHLRSPNRASTYFFRGKEQAKDTIMNFLAASSWGVRAAFKI